MIGIYTGTGGSPAILTLSKTRHLGMGKNGIDEGQLAHLMADKIDQIR